MGRGKLRMELISNEKERRLAFEKRRKGLEKMANDLSTLCGIDLCMIIYGQGNQLPNVPIICPSNDHQKVASMMHSYNSKSGNDCRYKAYGLFAFFNDETQRVDKKVKKVKDEIKESKYPTKLDEKFDFMSSDQLKDFACAISNKIDAVKERINLIKDFTNMEFNEMMLMNEGAWQRQNQNYGTNFPLSYSSNICDENQIRNFGLGTFMDYYGKEAEVEKTGLSQNGSLWMPSNFLPQTQMQDVAQGGDYSYGYLHNFDQMMNNFR